MGISSRTGEPGEGEAESGILRSPERVPLTGVCSTATSSSGEEVDAFDLGGGRGAKATRSGEERYVVLGRVSTLRRVA